jgi:hypothetical protein
MANTLEQQRIKLYKATPLRLILVEELISLIKNCFGNHIETNGIRFDTSHLRLGGLTVKMLEIDPQELGGVLVHWYPNFNISTQNDPYCSAYMLKPHEIRKIIHHINKIHEYYENNTSPLTK